jgi:hypothetical protein
MTARSERDARRRGRGSAPLLLLHAAGLLAAGLAPAGLLACAGAPAPASAPGRAILEVTCPVGDAVLWVDGRYVAQLRDLGGGIALRPGHHQIELRHERYHAYYGEVDLRPGQRRHVAVELADALP